MNTDEVLLTRAKAFRDAAGMMARYRPDGSRPDFFENMMIEEAARCETEARSPSAATISYPCDAEGRPIE